MRIAMACSVVLGALALLPWEREMRRPSPMPTSLVVKKLSKR